MIMMILIMTIFGLAKMQMLSLQDLTNKNGYILIKIGEPKPIEHYNKILRTINVMCTYTEITNLILQNIQAPKSGTTAKKLLQDMINKSFSLVIEKKLN